MTSSPPSGPDPTEVLRSLTRREREVLHLLHRRGPSTARELREAMEDPPGYSGIRTILRVMLDKGYVRRSTEGRAHVYESAGPTHATGRSALAEVVRTFFGGSWRDAAFGFLDEGDLGLSPVEEARLRDLIRHAGDDDGTG